MKYIVYCTVNLINKKIYIGVHKTENSNIFDGYLGNAVYANSPATYKYPKYPFLYAVKKYGPKNFKRITIKVFDNDWEAFALEAELVNEDFLKRQDVYNVAKGGHGGDIALLSTPVYLYDLKGLFIKKWDSHLLACKHINKSWSTLKMAIVNKRPTANYFWTEEKLDILDLTVYTSHNLQYIPIFEYNDKGLYNCCYPSITEASRCNNVETSNLSRACKAGYKCNNKYFSYKFMETFLIPIKEKIISKVYQYTFKGEFVAEYENCSKAEKALDVKPGLSKALKLGRTFAGFQWRREKLDSIDSIEVIKGKARKVAQCDLEGNVIKIFNTVTECLKEFSGCKHVLHGKRKTSGGYTFKYVD